MCIFRLQQTNKLCRFCHQGFGHVRISTAQSRREQRKVASSLARARPLLLRPDTKKHSVRNGEVNPLFVTARPQPGGHDQVPELCAAKNGVPGESECFVVAVNLSLFKVTFSRVQLH